MTYHDKIPVTPLSLPLPIKRQRATASFRATGLGWSLRYRSGEALLSYKCPSGGALEPDGFRLCSDGQHVFCPDEITKAKLVFSIP